MDEDELMECSECGQVSPLDDWRDDGCPACGNQGGDPEDVGISDEDRV